MTFATEMHLSFRANFPKESGAIFAHLWGSSESIGTAFISIVHELLKILQVLQQQSKAKLIRVVAIPITSSTSPRTNVLLWVHSVGSQAPDHTCSKGYKIEIIINRFVCPGGLKVKVLMIISKFSFRFLKILWILELHPRGCILLCTSQVNFYHFHNLRNVCAD